MAKKKFWKEFQHRLLQTLAPVIGKTYFFVLDKTSKKIILGQEHIDKVKKQSLNCIYTGWHEQILTGALAFQQKGITLLVSQSRDGEYISSISHRLGIHTARGSSSRGGVRGFLQLLRALKTTGDVIVVVDGPRGPAKECKAGAVTLAKRSGMPIIPTAVFVSRFKRVGSWDKTIIPIPFTTFFIGYGEPIFVPEHVEKDGIEQYRCRVTEALNRINEQVIDTYFTADERRFRPDLPPKK